MSVREVGCLVLRDIKREGDLLGDEEPDASVRDKPAENVHGILVQQLWQLLAGGVLNGDECVLRSLAPLHQVPHTDLPAGPQCVDQLNLVGVVSVVLRAGCDRKITDLLRYSSFVEIWYR